MAGTKKKIVFYNYLVSGCMNISVSLASNLLDNHSDRLEVWHVVDEQWKEKLAKIDSRFKFGVLKYDKPADNGRINEMVDKMEASMRLSSLSERAKQQWDILLSDPTLGEIDAKSEEIIRQIKPDLLICDQLFVLPAMVKAGCPYAFICSANPLILDFDGFPKCFSDARMDEVDKIQQFDREMAPFWAKTREFLLEFFKQRGTKFEHKHYEVYHIRSDHFVVYPYPAEINYFNEELEKKYNLWQIDTPLYAGRIPGPYKLPASFAALPGKIIYLSLGSLFSAYTQNLQKIVDILEKLPGYKYIVSKGRNGDGLVFPSNRFIGENYIDQLGVLQVLAATGGAMIGHGGNNTTCECFYFGVPCIILPCMGDQFNNATRIEETGFGFKMDLYNVTEKELATKLDRLLNDQELRAKWKRASERIQKENRINSVSNRIAEYVERL